MNFSLREYFRPMRDLVGPISLRTWLLIFLGPLAGFRIAPFLILGPSVQAIAGTAFIVLAGVAAWFDFRRPESGRRWPTITAISMVVALVTISIIHVPKQLYSDELLVTQVATEGLLHGQNPYSLNYRGTLLDEWVGNATHRSWINGQHPSATHYVYFPGQFLFSEPYNLLTKLLHLPYDQRYVYLGMYVAIVWILWRALRHSRLREPLIIAFIMSPFLMPPLAYGFNDLMPLLGLVITGVSLARGRMLAAAVALGLTLATKQWTMISIPFFAVWLWHALPQHRRFFAATFVTLSTLAIVILPFILWSAHDFADDTISFFTGTPAYPISGEGISHLLLVLGTVGPADRFPFWIFEVIIALPILVFLLRWLWKHPTLERLYLTIGIATWIVWFFSRYLLNFHVIAVIMVMLLAFVLEEIRRTKPSI